MLIPLLFLRNLPPRREILIRGIAWGCRIRYSKLDEFLLPPPPPRQHDNKTNKKGNDSDLPCHYGLMNHTEAPVLSPVEDVLSTVILYLLPDWQRMFPSR